MVNALAHHLSYNQKQQIVQIFSDVGYTKKIYKAQKIQNNNSYYFDPIEFLRK